MDWLHQDYLAGVLSWLDQAWGYGEWAVVARLWRVTARGA